MSSIVSVTDFDSYIALGGSQNPTISNANAYVALTNLPAANITFVPDTDTYAVLSPLNNSNEIAVADFDVYVVMDMTTVITPTIKRRRWVGLIGD